MGLGLVELKQGGSVTGVGEFDKTESVNKDYSCHQGSVSGHGGLVILYV